MPERIGVSRQKTIHLLVLNLIWLIGSAVPAGELVTVMQKQQPELVAGFFLISCICICRQRGMKESARGRTEERRDRVSTRLNPLWPRSSILYRLNATTATALSSSLLSFLSCGSECETRYWAEWFEYAPVWAGGRGFRFPSFFLSPPLYHWEGIPSTLALN